MAGFARLIAFDKRGMGLSDRDVGETSEGGPAATMLAAAHPERVNAMVQYATYARISSAPDYPDGIPAESLRAFWRQMRENWGDPSSIKLWAPSIAEGPESREWWPGCFARG